MDYRIGFFAVSAALAALVAGGAAAFDGTIEAYLSEPEPPPRAAAGESEYAFLDPRWYEGIDLLPESYERNVRTAGEFLGWAEGYRDEALSAGLHATEFDGSESIPRGGHVLNRLVAGGDLVVYEAVPDRPNGKAVVVVPGNGHQGARDVMGVPSEYSDGYYHGEIGRRLAEVGYAVYAPELLGRGERQVDAGQACAAPWSDAYQCSSDAFGNSLAMYGIDIGRIHANETAAAYALALSGHGRVAVAGLSNGCGGALSVAHANRDTVGAVVLASCAGRTHEIPMGLELSGAGQNLRAEPVDEVRALAPVPLYVSYGSLESGLFGYAVESGDVKRMVAEAYDLVGHPGRFTYVVHGGGHTFDAESVIEFLDGAY